MPCPYCRAFHLFDLRARYIKLNCSEGSADLFYLVWAGDAPRPLLEIFVSGKSMTTDPELLAVTQPRGLWGDVRVISDDIANRLDVSES